MDSVFSLQRPYDLMALLKQEERAEMLESLKQELLSRKGDLDGNDDKDTGLCVVWCSLDHCLSTVCSMYYVGLIEVENSSMD